MRVMFRFEKGSAIRFISHLDLLRAFQRALLRSGLPVEWSRGFHPHPQFSFAMALPVGAESTGEYMEAALSECDPVRAAAGLNTALGPGLRVTDAGGLPGGAPSLMAAVAASDWSLEAPAGLEREDVVRLLARSSVPVEKAGKNGSRMTDIRPGVLELHLAETPAGRFVQARLAAGSRNNVAPALLLRALAPGGDAAGLRVCRRELYYDRNGALRPLYEMAYGD